MEDKKRTLADMTTEEKLEFLESGKRPTEKDLEYINETRAAFGYPPISMEDYLKMKKNLESQEKYNDKLFLILSNKE